MARFDLGQNIRNPKTVPATVEGFYKAADAPETGRICGELADAHEALMRGELTKDEYRTMKASLKLGLPFYTPHAHFAKGYKSSEGEPVDSGKVVIDVDGCDHFTQLYERHLKGRERALGINMVNRSVSGMGGHVLFDIPEGMTRQQAQAWMAHELGNVSYDKAVHERERAIYIPCRAYILYIDDELMFSDTLHGAKGVGAKDLNDAKGAKGAKGAKAPRPFTPADERTRFIAQGVMREKGLEAKDFLDEGGRHTSVKMFLSGATPLLTEAEVNGVLRELMPDHWADENIQTLVGDFYTKYHDPTQRLLKYQEALFTQSRRLGVADEESGLTAEPPAMPAKLPKLIALLTSQTPAAYKAAVAHAVFPPLATHLCEVRFRYTDHVEHEATLMNCLMAGTGAGKGCIDKPIEHIMADIERRDKENERREAEWKSECLKKGANKDKPLRPEGLVIQIIDPDMTKPALVTRMDESEGHFVYVKLNELDLFEQLKGATGKQHFQLMCLAFDSDSTYGQTRVGTQSVTARPMCRFNWNACTTILKGRRFFSKVLTDGPISRINFCTIPEQEIGAPQPIYGEYDLAFDEALKPYIDNLVAARGLIACPQAYRLAKELLKECSEFAQLSQNDTYWNLSHRACVIAWLKACVLYVANGQKWEKSIENFTRWSLNYDLWCKMMFFGDAIERATNGDDSRIGTRGPQNMMTQLADEFTLDDVKRICQKEGKDPSRAIKIIRNWMNRNYLIQNSEFSFQKSEKFKGKVINEK